MLLTSFQAGSLRANCYLVSQHTGGEALIIDPGEGATPQVRAMLDYHRLTPAAVLLTHGHIDHIWSAQQVCDELGIPAYIHANDRPMLTDPLRGVRPWIRRRLVGAMFSEPKQVVELADGDKLELAGIAVTVHHTPGHTVGSVTFAVAEPGGTTCGMLFSGDTLFRGTVGRTDFKGGSSRDLLNSVGTKLLALDDDTVVLPGHGDRTTIGRERRNNPCLKDWPCFGDGAAVSPRTGTRRRASGKFAQPDDHE